MEAGFLDGTQGPLFHILHPPRTAEAKGCVLYVPPFAEELNKSRRMVAEQARRLAAAGYAVLLPDLYGCGDSGGDLPDARWDGWLDDLRLCAETLCERFPAPLYLWGLRTGCLLAGALAQGLQVPPAGLVYWQPVSNGKLFLTQFLRLRMAAGMMGGDRETTTELRNRLGAGETLEIAGYALTPHMAQALEAARLSSPPQDTPVHWLEVMQGDAPQLPPASQRKVDDWREAGITVRTAVVPGEPFWSTQEIRTVPALWRETLDCLQSGSKPAVRATEPSALPLVSVIMPAFNASAYIEEAIDSVLAQDYPNKELIVIDDGSSDDTVARVQAYGDRVQLLTQANQGSAVARNQGLDAAKGAYIAFLDSDDVWLPGKLTAQVGYLEAHPEIGMIYSDWLPWKRDKQSKAFPSPETLIPAAPDAGVPPEEIPLLTEGSGWLYNRLLFGSLLHTITVMARRELIEQVGRFDPELKRGQDYDYWLRASRHTEIHQLDRVFALYRLHGSGCITQWPDINYEKLVVEKALARWGLEGPTGERSDRKAVERRLAGTCFDFGYHHYWSGNPRKASRSFLQALRHHPRHLGSWRYAGMSLAMGLFKAR